jgi:hypothetical protein
VNLGVNGTNFVVGQFPLISYSGSIGGDGFTALSLSSLPSGVGGYLSNNLANPSVDLVITNAPPVINPLPGTILASVSGSTLTLSWPTNLGWLLQQQTNPPLVGLSTNWVTVPGSSMVTSTNLPISRANGSAFFRMVHP